ncbi:MAG TPA: PepSY domain-containing protein [Opitutaceae bacterium]|nr:PepSY domain-containing protein [Opitutaceae bacterium]
MKTLLLSVVAALGLLVLVPLSQVSAKEKDATPRGSIRPKGKPTATERAALAKISFQDAYAAAVAAVPGQVTYGELEVEDGNLQYDFEIITPSKKVIDVSIDAGNGRVLDVDEGDDE